MNKIVAYISATLLTLSIASTAIAGPSMYSDYIMLKDGVTAQQCVDRGLEVLNEIKFTQISTKQGDDMIFAENSEYTVHMRCLPLTKGGVVFLLIAGPESTVAAQAGQVIKKRF